MIGPSRDTSFATGRGLDIVFFQPARQALKVLGRLSPRRQRVLEKGQKIERREQEAYNLPLAVRIKGAVSCPVMAVGGFRSYDLVRKTIIDGAADYVSLARPFIREPWIARRWEEGDTARARCISCNGCFKPGMKEGGIYCVVDKLEGDSKGESL